MLGLKALILLYVEVGLVSSLVFCRARSSAEFSSSPRLWLRLYHQILLFLALPFFIWAIVNTAEGSFDLGILSFGFVLVSLVATLFASADFAAGCVHGALVPVSCLGVVANYAYALTVVSTPVTFVVYAVSGLVVWLLAAIVGVYISKEIATSAPETAPVRYKPLQQGDDV